MLLQTDSLITATFALKYKYVYLYTYFPVVHQNRKIEPTTNVIVQLIE